MRRPAIAANLSHRLTFAAACMPLVFSAAYAQKGMGDMEGVVRQGLRAPLVKLAARVIRVETHPCEQTTGPSPAGTHLIVAGGEGTEYNVHLGPADSVATIAKELKPGGQVEILAFRTVKLPKNHYVAVRLVLQDKGTVFHVRDSNLRPFWSERSNLGTVRGRGFGQGRGRNAQLGGAGQGQGAGQRGRGCGTLRRLYR